MVSMTKIQIYENIYYGTQAGPDQPLGAKEGITFAFGISDFLGTDVSNDQYLDYGTLAVYYEFWNDEENDFIPMKTRPCIEEDFGLHEDLGHVHETLFYPAGPTKRDEMKRKLGSLQCIDEPVEMIGNWNTGVAQVIEVYFEICDPTLRTTCKPEAEVREWLKEHYILFAYNKTLFNGEKFGDDTYTKMTWIDWIPFDIQN